MPVTLYGIPNCDTVKKARAWLDRRGVAYAFHDYKAAGIARGVLEGWAREAGWEVLLNRAGTTESSALMKAIKETSFTADKNIFPWGIQFDEAAGVGRTSASSEAATNSRRRARRFGRMTGRVTRLAC